MNHCTELESRPTRRILPIASTTALALAFTLSLPQAAHADEVTPPRVPADIQVEAGNELFLEGHGVGTQNYICLPSGSGFAWTLFTPEATLLDRYARQITTHFFSPNPYEKGTVRATWEHSRDTSTVWAALVKQSVDPNFVEQGAIPWLLLQKAGVREGPTGGDTLTATSFIQRLNTHGGSAPSTGCGALGDVGKKAFVPYSADYLFYTNHNER